MPRTKKNLDNPQAHIFQQFRMNSHIRRAFQSLGFDISLAALSLYDKSLRDVPPELFYRLILSAKAYGMFPWAIFKKDRPTYREAFTPLHPLNGKVETPMELLGLLQNREEHFFFLRSKVVGHEPDLDITRGLVHYAAPFDRRSELLEKVYGDFQNKESELYFTLRKVKESAEFIAQRSGKTLVVSQFFDVVAQLSDLTGTSRNMIAGFDEHNDVRIDNVMTRAKTAKTTFCSFDVLASGWDFKKFDYIIFMDSPETGFLRVMDVICAQQNAFTDAIGGVYYMVEENNYYNSYYIERVEKLKKAYNILNSEYLLPKCEKSRTIDLIHDLSPLLF